MSEEKAWYIHFQREFGEWLKPKFKKIFPRVVNCDKCNRLAISHPERLSKEYCQRVGIPFLCGSCLYPQYEISLCSPTRGNIDKIYGKRFVPHKNEWVTIT